MNCTCLYPVMLIVCFFQDMVECEMIDRLSILTYLSQFYQAFHDKTPHSSSSLVGADEVAKIMSSNLSKQNRNGRAGGGGGVPIIGKRNEPCKVCGNLVFILERLNVGGKLLHRTCFKVIN